MTKQQVRSPERKKKQPSGDYSVGYCRPPVSTQWKPGQSGRPASAKQAKKAESKIIPSIVEALQREITKTITATEGGREVRVDMPTYFAKMLVADFVKGTPSQRLKLFKELRSLGVLQRLEEPAESFDALEDLIQLLAEEAEKEFGPGSA